MKSLKKITLAIIIAIILLQGIIYNDSLSSPSSVEISIKLSTETVLVGSYVTVTVSLRASGLPIANGEVKLYVNQSSSWVEIDILKTDKDGIASTNLVFDSEGIYVINATYGSNSKTCTLTVYDETTLTLSDISASYGETVILSARLTSKNTFRNIPNATISFYIFNKRWIFIGLNKTDNKGVAVFRWYVNISPASYLLKACFMGTKIYRSCEKIVSVSISKGKLMVFTNISKQKLFVGEEIKVYIRVATQSGEPLSNFTVKVTIQTVSRRIIEELGVFLTNSNGEVTVTWIAKSEGEFLLVIEVAETKNYEEKKVELFFTVVQIPQEEDDNNSSGKKLILPILLFSLSFITLLVTFLKKKKRKKPVRKEEKIEFI